MQEITAHGLDDWNKSPLFILIALMEEHFFKNPYGLLKQFFLSTVICQLLWVFEKVDVFISNAQKRSKVHTSIL